MNTNSKTYRIVLDGKQYAGTAEDVARWYCKQRGIKLYEEDDGGSEAKALYAYFSEGNKREKIAQFKGEVPDLEAGYGLFFTEYLLIPDELDCSIMEISPQPSADELTGEVIEYMNRLHPDRDACFEAACRIACEAIRVYDYSIENVEQYIRIVLQNVSYTYPKLLELKEEVDETEL